MICERFDVDPQRAAELDAHPTWSRVVDALIVMMAYRDTYVRYRKKQQGELKDLPGDLPFLREVHDNAFELTKIRAKLRAEERQQSSG